MKEVDMDDFPQPPSQSDPKDVELENNISRIVRRMGQGLRIHVRGGHVTISGIVDDFGTKRQISQEVQAVGGVREVTNNIRVSRE
jgi:osmotically-inducible protein OsmY